MKGAPKHGEKVNPTDTRPEIVVETVNSPDVLRLKLHKQLQQQQKQQQPI
jgi:hypothetical protein